MMVGTFILQSSLNLMHVEDEARLITYEYGGNTVTTLTQICAPQRLQAYPISSSRSRLNQLRVLVGNLLFKICRVKSSKDIT